MLYCWEDLPDSKSWITEPTHREESEYLGDGPGKPTLARSHLVPGGPTLGREGGDQACLFDVNDSASDCNIHGCSTIPHMPLGEDVLQV